MKGLNKAIELLCDEIDYGHLKAQTDSKAFIEEVTEIIKRLRKEKEWLIEKYTSNANSTANATNQLKEELMRLMQQALQEGVL